jgi:peptide/nickel transport system substrate-binding protein
LPPNTILPQITSLTAQVADMQSKINTVNANIAILSTTSSGYMQGIADIKGLQANLNQTNTALAKAQLQYDSAMDAARQSLFALDYTNEPTLGDWMPAGQQNGAWINKVNTAHPFNVSKFESASYKYFASEDDAVKAFQNNEVDSILESNGLSVNGHGTIGDSALMEKSPNQNLFFLVFKLSNPILSDLAYRQVLMCILDTHMLAGQLSNENVLTSFVELDEKFWNNPQTTLPCIGLDSASRISQAIQILKTAGYTWKVLPSPTANGQGLTSMTGEAFPEINLFVSSSDEQGENAGKYIRQQLSLLGVPVTMDSINSEDLRYAVFSDHQYDMALLGYNVSEYPAYLCDWFKTGNPFGYQSDSLQSACEALNSTSDLTMAQKDVYEIQSILVQDLPFIPLYSGITYDAYRNIKYPFDSVLGGLSGVYGAPSLAIPAP